MLVEEKKLLEQLRCPDSRSEAFRRLVEYYQKPIYYHIRRMVISHDDADDLTQETFVKAWLAIGTFRAESKLLTWLYRIATNEALRFLSRKRRRLMLPLVDVERYLEQLIVHNGFVDAEQALTRLYKAMLRLPERQRLVFQLRYFDELPYGDIAYILGTSVGNAKAAYHWASKKIEKFLSEP